MPWLRKTKPDPYQALVRQWKRQRLLEKIQRYPLRLLLRHQCRSLEDCAVAKTERTGWFPALLKLLKPTAKKMLSGNSKSELMPELLLPPSRSLQTLASFRVNLQRRLVVWLLATFLWLLRVFLGLPRSE